jgi:glycosyltransferase involved in cell wall biosynthesis
MRGRAEKDAVDCQSREPRGTGLRIGLDARLLGDHLTGIGYYVSELCKAVDHILPGAEFFLYAPWAIKAPVESPRWHVRIDPWRAAFEHLRGSWMTKHAWMPLRAGQLAVRDRVNVFWATDSPFIPRLPSGIRVVATVHDFRHRMTPDKMRRAALYGRIVLERRLWRVDAFIANSSGTAQKLRRFLGHGVVGIARPAVSQHFLRRGEIEVAQTLAKYGIRRPYLLTLSSVDPHKNIKLLAETFLAMRAEGITLSHMLVLVGKKSDQLLETLDRTGRTQVVGIKALGYVPEEDLPALYSGADVFILPSLDEGFGMPVLEARACQTRIVTSDLTELHEAGGDRPVYIRPDAKGIRDGILAALAAEPPSKPDHLWTWESSARVLADAFDL